MSKLADWAHLTQLSNRKSGENFHRRVEKLFLFHYSDIVRVNKFAISKAFLFGWRVDCLGFRINRKR